VGDFVVFNANPLTDICITRQVAHGRTERPRRPADPCPTRSGDRERGATMLNRRQFLAASATGMAACAFGGGAAAFDAQGARREVSVAGRRVKTIDVHCHCVIPGIMEMLGQTTPANALLIIGPERVREMDRQGIDVEALSINPFWYAADRELAGRLIRMQNEQLAAVCAMYPDRLVGLATVALQHPDLAAQQLEFGVTRLGLRGASLGASVNGEELASPRFEPFWAAAERLDAPVFIHPQGAPALSSRLQGNGVLTNVIGNPLDTTIALSHLIFEGTLDRFPGLKICAAHGGGYLPSYADRSDHGCLTFPGQCNRTLRKRPTEYLKQLYFDSLVFSGEALRHLIAVSGVSQLVLGTDYPFPWTSTAIDHVLDAPGLSDADRIAILGGNAARLLKIAA
jgi:aminocarboxymuconate-semialdehyde decarboxylase